MKILIRSHINASSLVMLWLALATSACGSDEKNELSGSIGEAGYSLEFDRVRISRSSSLLLIQYVADDTLGNGQAVLNQPVRLEMDLSQVTPKVDTAYDIPMDLTIEHAVIALDSLGQPFDEPDFPRLSDGELNFDEIGDALESRVAGEFSCLFENNFTLSGKFSAQLSAP